MIKSNNRNQLILILVCCMLPCIGYAQEMLPILKNRIHSRYTRLYGETAILLPDAHEQQVTVTPNELEEKQNSFINFLPKRYLRQLQFKNSLILEKYLHHVKGIFPRAEDMDYLFNTLTRGTDSIQKFTKESMEPLLKTMAIFYNPGVRGCMEELKNREKPPLYWANKELMLNAPSLDCLVKDGQSGDCILSVDQFNSMVSLTKRPKTISKDSTRRQILLELLENICFSTLAEESGFSKKRGVKGALSQRERNFQKQQRLLSSGAIITEEATLLAAYDSYYHDYFAPREEVFIDLVGSMDSSYIDSLFTVLKSDVQNVLSKTSVQSNNDTMHIPWKTTSWTELPDELVIPTDTLMEGECTHPIKTDYGYFIARINTINQRDEITIDEAYNSLITLATRDHWYENDSILTTHVHQYYRNNLIEFQTPDTMLIRLSLIPDVKYSRVHTFNEVSQRATRTISSLDLPHDVQVTLMNRYDTHKGRTNEMGPLSTKYGLFYITVLEYHKGRKQLSCNRVFAQIENRLRENPDTFAKFFSKEQKKQIRRMCLGHLYRQEAIKKIESLSAKATTRGVESEEDSYNNENYDTQRSDDYLQKKRALVHLYTDQEATFAKWLKNVAIDYSLLH